MIQRITGIVLMIMGAGCWLLLGSTPATAGRVTVLISINDPGLTLTLTDAEVNVGPVDPGQEGGDSVAGEVVSNKRWSLSYAASDLSSATDVIPVEAVTVSGTDIAAPVSLSKNGTIYADMEKAKKKAPYRFVHTYRIAVPWTADPGLYCGILVYSATQL